MDAHVFIKERQKIPRSYSTLFYCKILLRQLKLIEFRPWWPRPRSTGWRACPTTAASRHRNRPTCRWPVTYQEHIPGQWMPYFAKRVEVYFVVSKLWSPVILLGSHCNCPLASKILHKCVMKRQSTISKTVRQRLWKQPKKEHFHDRAFLLIPQIVCIGKVLDLKTRRM